MTEQDRERDEREEGNRLAQELEALDEVVADGAVVEDGESASGDIRQGSPLAAAREVFELINRVRSRQAEQEGKPEHGSIAKRESEERQGGIDTSQPNLHELDTQAVAPAEPVATSEEAGRDWMQTQIGQYEVVDEIARGGMGVVFRARHKELDREVALKMMLAGPFALEEEKKRFRVEAEAAAQLDHPNIVPVYDVGEHHGQPYFTMAYVRGTTLATVIQTEPLEPRIAAEMTKQIAEAVQYAHSKGVLHRDIKPLNILLDQQGRPKITDFGLARRTDADSNLTGTGQILGTPNFMAPEQATGISERIGPLSDVYSIGANLYSALTGRPPFQAANVMDTLRLVIEQDAVSPRDLNPNIPADLATICMKCLQKEPRLRYASAAELADDLGRFLRQEPIRARPVSRLERAVKWSKRNPVVAGLLLSVATTLMALTIGGLWYQWQLSRALTESETRGAENARLLYESLTSEARFLNKVRPPGYTSRVWHLLAQARKLDTPARDLSEVRQLALSSLGQFAAEKPDVFSDLDSKVMVADVTPDDRFVIAGMLSGQILVLDREGELPVQRLQDGPNGIAGIRVLDDRTFMSFTPYCRTISFWKRATSGKWSRDSHQKVLVRKGVYPVKPTIDGRFVIGWGPLDGNDAAVANWDHTRQTAGKFNAKTKGPLHFYVQPLTGKNEVVDAEPVPLSDVPATSRFDVSDSYLVAVGGTPRDSWLNVVSLRTREVERKIRVDCGNPNAVVISADSRFIACSAHRGLQVFNRETGRELARVDDEGPCFVSSFVGRHGDVFFDRDHDFVWFSTRLQQPLARFDFEADMGVIRAASAGRQFLWVGRKRTQVTDLYGNERREYSLHAGRAIAVLFSPGGQLMMSASESGEIRLSRTRDGAELARLSGNAFTISPDGRFVVVYQGGRLVFWNMADGSKFGELECEQLALELDFDPTGKFLAQRNQEGIAVWELRFSSADSPAPHRAVESAKIEGKVIWRYQTENPYSLAWSPDSTQVAFHATEADSDIVRLYTVATREITTLCRANRLHPDSIRFLSEKRMVVLDAFELELWDVSKREQLATGPRGTYYPIDLSPDRRFVIGGNRIHPVDDLERYVDLPLLNNRIWAVDWSDDGRTLAMGLTNGTIGVWKLEAIKKRLSTLELDFPIDCLRAEQPLESTTRLIALCETLPDRRATDLWETRYDDVRLTVEADAMDGARLHERIDWLIDKLPLDVQRPFQDRTEDERTQIKKLVDLSRTMTKRGGHASSHHLLTSLIARHGENASSNVGQLLAISYAYHTLGDLYHFQYENKLPEALQAYREEALLMERVRQQTPPNARRGVIPSYRYFWMNRNLATALARHGDLDAAIARLKSAMTVAVEYPGTVDAEQLKTSFQTLIDWLVKAKRSKEVRDVFEQSQKLPLELELNMPPHLTLTEEREIAEWVLHRNGGVEVRTANGLKRCRDSRDLPDQFSEVTMVDLRFGKPQDMPAASEMHVLRHLSSMQYLNISHNPSPAADLSDLLSILCKSKKLKTLFVSGTKIGVLELEKIVETSSLETVNIYRTPAAEDPRLSDLRRKLKRCLVLANTSEAASHSLCNLTDRGELVVVCADGRRLTLRKPDDFPREGFRLVEVRPDPGREFSRYTVTRLLPGIEALEVLDLGGRNDVSDAMIEDLSQFKFLRRMKLDGTKVTAQGLAKLRQSLPNCEITAHGR